MDKQEDLKYQLETLASYEPKDLDNPEFEVGYEDNNGNEGFATICCVDVATRALERIKELELDSKRWNAFINSPFRLFGYAGLDHKEPNRPDQELGKNGYAHFGCEMWTIHSGWKAGAGKNILTGYADQAIIAQSK